MLDTSRAERVTKISLFSIPGTGNSGARPAIME